MKKYKLTRQGMKLMKNMVIDDIDGKAISFSEQIKMDGCIVGEESIIVSIFSNNLCNKKYFKEIKE